LTNIQIDREFGNLTDWKILLRLASAMREREGEGEREGRRGRESEGERGGKGKGERECLLFSFKLSFQIRNIFKRKIFQ